MADKVSDSEKKRKLEDAVPDRMHVTPKVREKELLQKKDNFTSTGMDQAAWNSDLEDGQSEFKRNLDGIQSKFSRDANDIQDRMREKLKYAKGGAVLDFAKGGAVLPRTKYKWGK